MFDIYIDQYLYFMFQMEANQITEQKTRGIKILKFRIVQNTLITRCAAATYSL